MKAHGIDLEQDAIREFCNKRKIRELRVFGSILRDDFNAESDVDFLADWDEDVEWDAFDHMDMEDQLGISPLARERIPNCKGGCARVRNDGWRVAVCCAASLEKCFRCLFNGGNYNTRGLVTICRRACCAAQAAPDHGIRSMGRLRSRAGRYPSTGHKIHDRSHQ